MNKDENKSNTLAKRFEKLEQSKQEKKKDKKNTKIFGEPLDLPEIDLFGKKKEVEKNNFSIEQNNTDETKTDTTPVKKEDHSLLKEEIINKPSAASFIHPLEQKEETSTEVDNSEILPTAHIAQQRLHDILKEDNSQDSDSYDQKKGIASKLKVQPETSSMTLEEIKKRKFIAKPEVKKSEKKDNAFFPKFLMCLIPAFLSFLIVVLSDNVRSLINQDGFTGTFYLIVLYVVFLSIFMGLKFIISYYKPKKVNNQTI